MVLENHPGNPELWTIAHETAQKHKIDGFLDIPLKHLVSVMGFWGFTWPVILDTCLKGMTKNSSFLHFRAVFMSYCPLFWVFEVIYKAHDTHYMFERHVPKLIIFAFMAIFLSYCP
jgi:hypothetical protein